MTDMANNGPEPLYYEKLQAISGHLLDFEGQIYIVTHIDPDGDAIGSSLGMARALQSIGKKVNLVAEPPPYLRFLGSPEEFHSPLESVPRGALLLVLDSAEVARVAGAPVEGFVINIDHHGTNPRFGDLSVVDPSKAATAQIIKDLVNIMEIRWTPEIATPVLTGIITDTGNFRHSNTTPEVLHDAAELVGHNVNLAELTDRLQWRPPAYYKTLGAVLSTVQFHFEGRLVTANLPPDQHFEDDSDDFVGIIRYAEGSQLAIFLRTRGPDVKISIRSRGEVSAQAVAVKLGGGGHVPAAGATLKGMNLEQAYPKVLAAVAEALNS